MLWKTIGLTLTTAGEVMLAYMVVSVHDHIRKERKIDEDVLNYLGKERYVVYVAVGMIILGYFLQVLNM